MRNSFGDNLKTLMKERNLSIRALARDLQISHRTVAEWFGAGNRMPRDPGALRKLADYFRCSVHQLLYGEEDPRSILGGFMEKTEIQTGLYEITIRKVKTK